MGTFLLVLFYCLWAVPIGIIVGATVGIVAGTIVNTIRDAWDRD